MVPVKFLEIVATLRSGRATMLLLLATALVAAAGTLFTPEQVRTWLEQAIGERGVAVATAIGVIDVFHGPLFAALLVSMGLSVALCTWHRLPIGNLFSSGYSGGGRRRWTLVVDAAMHLSILLVLVAAAVESLFSFVGTKNMHVGVPESMTFDWRAGHDVPLGFETVVEALGLTHFPAQAKIGITDAATGQRLGLLTVREGAGVETLGGSLAFRNVRLDAESSALHLDARQDTGVTAVRFSTAVKGPSEAVVGKYRLTLVAWRRDVREVLSRVAIRERGQVVRREQLRVNDRIRHRGWNLYLTAWGRDEYGNDYAGIQVTRDPGAILFWCGSVLFSVCLPVFFVLRRGGRFSCRPAQDELVFTAVPASRVAAASKQPGQPGPDYGRGESPVLRD